MHSPTPYTHGVKVCVADRPVTVSMSSSNRPAEVTSNQNWRSAMKRIFRSNSTLLIALVNITCLFPAWEGESRAQDTEPAKYNIDTTVDCNDYCSSNWRMHWACAIGYNFSGACIVPDEGSRGSRPQEGSGGRSCRLVGICYNREQDEANRRACAERYQSATQDCSPNNVVNFSCSSENSQIFGYECEGTDPQSGGHRALAKPAKLKPGSVKRGDQKTLGDTASVKKEGR
jgi:hypothetical protein